MKMRLGSVVIYMSAALSFAAAAQQPAHEHGVGRAQVALDGRDLLIDVQIPAHDLLGFEHSPSSAEELQQVADVREKWSQTGVWVQLNSAATCALRSFDLQVGTGPEEHQRGDHDHHAHDHDQHSTTHPDHSDVRMSLSFQCQAPEQLRDVQLNPFVLAAALQELRYESIWPTGQGSGRLRPEQLSVSLSN